MSAAPNHEVKYLKYCLTRSHAFVIMFIGGYMETELLELEKYWGKYLSWCNGQGLAPDFGDYLTWLDDYDINVGQNDG